MKHNIATFLIALLPALVPAQSAPDVSITVQTGQPGDTISRHIYGHFAEHLGRCIYDGLYVGEDNTTIAHTDGVRMDIINALRELHIPNLRWPGGCFADTYHWKEGVGPKDMRPTMVNQWWGGVTEDNSFGTHEFLNLCEELDTEPYISANVGSGTVKELSDWIAYVNHDGISPMADWRRANGREEPWDVMIWGVGNETWGCGGNMTAEYYANVYRQYATFMTDWSNSTGIFRVASGSYGDNYNWTEVLMRDVPGKLLEAVALHHYSVIDWSAKGSATDFTEAQYFATMDEALKMEEYVSGHAAVMDKYDPDKRVALYVDEWGGWYDVEPGTNPGFLFQQNTMRDAVLAGASLNIFNNHCDRVRMANIAQTVNVLQAMVLTDGPRMLLTPTYHVFKMYREHHDAVLLPVEIENMDYHFGDASLPAVSASASRSPDGAVRISLVNIDLHNAHTISLNMAGDFSRVEGTLLTSERVQDHNTFAAPETVVPEVFDGFSKVDGGLEVELPPVSVVVLVVE